MVISGIPDHLKLFMFRLFAGYLCDSVQGKVPADGEPGGPEGDQVGARGGGALHSHQGGFTPQGSQTC